MNDHIVLDKASCLAGFALLFTGFYKLADIGFYAVGCGIIIALGIFLFDMPKINKNNKEENS